MHCLDTITSVFIVTFLGKVVSNCLSWKLEQGSRETDQGGLRLAPHLWEMVKGSLRTDSPCDNGPASFFPTSSAEEGEGLIQEASPLKL